MYGLGVDQTTELIENDFVGWELIMTVYVCYAFV